MPNELRVLTAVLAARCVTWALAAASRAHAADAPAARVHRAVPPATAPAIEPRVVVRSTPSTRPRGRTA